MPNAPSEDWGRICALLANLYGLKPWEISQLTPTQVRMYLDNSGFVRFLRDLPVLQGQFAKLDDEAKQKLIDEADKPADPNSLSARAWRVYVQNYNAMDEEAEQTLEEASPLAGLSREGAEAIVAWIESQEMTQAQNGPVVWRLRLAPLWAGLKATARG